MEISTRNKLELWAKKNHTHGEATSHSLLLSSGNLTEPVNIKGRIFKFVYFYVLSLAIQ